MKKGIVFLVVLIVGFFNETYAQKYKFGKVSKEELEEKIYPLDSTAEAAYLYKSKRVRFEYNTAEGGFDKIEEVYVRIKIYNKEGFEYGNQKILFYDPKKAGSSEDVGGIKAVTYNLIGGKIEEQKVKRKEIYLEEKNKFYSYKKIPFPNVKEGSIIELKYTLRSGYFHISPYWIQEDIPTKKIVYSTAIPEYFNFKTTTKGYHTIAPEIETISGSISFGTEVVNYTEKKSLFEGEDIPALKNDEPFINNYQNYKGVVCSELASYQFPGGYLKRVAKTWKDVCAKLYDSYSFGHELKKSAYYKKDLELILASSGSDQSAKMASIFEFVKSKIKWNKYNGVYTDKGVSSAYKKGEGNIAEVNLVLVSMLRKAGIDAHPIVLSTKKHGVPLFPTIDGLNYVIAGVQVSGGKVVFLDASGKYNGVNVLPARDLNWEGRMMISKEINVPVSLEAKKYSEEFYMANLSFDENFKLSGKVMAKYTNREALKFRNKYNSLSDEKLQEKLEEKFDVSLNNIDVKNKGNVYKPIMASLEVSSEELVEEINGKVYMDPLLFFSEIKSPFKLESRKYPVDLVNPCKITKSIVVKIPDGYRVVSVPKSLKVKMNENTGSYTFLVNQTGSIISIKAVKQFNKSLISTQQYPELKSLYQNIVSKNKEKIVLEKITVASVD